MINECLLHRCQESWMKMQHQLQKEIQTTCAIWCLKSRLLLPSIFLTIQKYITKIYHCLQNCNTLKYDLTVILDKCASWLKILKNTALIHFQGARMDDQRCSLPQIRPTENHLSPKRDEGPPRSASFSTKSDMEQTKSREKASPKEVYDSLVLLNNFIKLQDLE